MFNEERIRDLRIRVKELEEKANVIGEYYFNDIWRTLNKKDVGMIHKSEMFIDTGYMSWEWISTDKVILYDDISKKKDEIMHKIRRENE